MQAPDWLVSPVTAPVILLLARMQQRIYSWSALYLSMHRSVKHVSSYCCHADVCFTLAVFLDGQQLKMRALETEQQHEMGGVDENRALIMNWDLHYPELGNTVEVITQYMRVVVWLNHESFLEDVSPCLQSLTCLHEQMQSQR